MAYSNRLGGHTNTYHTYSLEEALEGIAAAGFKFVELTAVRGWTEHVPLEADAKTLAGIQRMMNRLGLVAISLSGHSDLTTKDGLALGLKAVDLCQRMGIDIMNTAIGGHYSEQEDEEAFMGATQARAYAKIPSVSIAAVSSRHLDKAEKLATEVGARATCEDRRLSTTRRSRRSATRCRRTSTPRRRSRR